MTKTFCGLLTPMIAITLSTTACGSDDSSFGGEARFADASEEDRGSAAGMLLSGELLLYFSVFGAEGNSESGCPAKSVDGATVTYAGGCANGDNEFEGSLAVTNGNIDLFEGVPDPTAPTVLVFDDWRETTSDGVLAADGTTSVSNSLRDVGSIADRVNDFDMEFTGTDEQTGERRTVNVRIDTTSRCEIIDETQTECTFNAGSNAAVAGVGSFEVSGSFTIGGEQASGELTLTGADTMVVTIGECATFEIDGQPAGEFCGPAE